MARPLGVGFLGAGAATQAIHLPTVASLGGRARVVAVMDPDAELAGRVAATAGGYGTGSAERVVTDPRVDIVAVCSPPSVHLEQIEMARRAGKRAIFCEKPLAETAAQAHAVMTSPTASPVVVGTMHAFDPAYRCAQQAWEQTAGRARHVRSVIVLPSNDEMIVQATEPLAAARSGPAAPPRSAPRPPADRLRSGLLGLTIHNAPQLRAMLPTVDRVGHATVLTPFGYSMALEGNGCTAQLAALLPGRWAPQWTFEAWSEQAVMRVRFPPSYVLAGSAVAELRTGSETRRWQFPTNGYQAEWHHVIDLAEQRPGATDNVAGAIADLEYALSVAELASAVAGTAA